MSQRKLPDLFGQRPDADCDARIRAGWRSLAEERLPQAARAKGWQIRHDHCFARILLDVACGRPWREVIRPPAWRNAPLPVLQRAIALGEAVLQGRRDLDALNRQSLALRGHR